MKPKLEVSVDLILNINCDEFLVLIRSLEVNVGPGKDKTCIVGSHAKITRARPRSLHGLKMEFVRFLKKN
jgi:hypothetical protein